MKEKDSTAGYVRIYAVTTAISLLCIVVSMIFAAGRAGGVFSFGLEAVRNMGFKETTFSTSFKNALTSDFIYCTLIVMLSMPLPVIPAIYIAMRCVSLGVTLGLAAKCRVLKDILMISLGAFASNILTLPLYILLFVLSVRFSLGISSLGRNFREYAVSYLGLVLKTATIFALMCIAQCIQMGLGVFILGRF